MKAGRILIALVLALTLTPPRVAQATTYTVTSTSDSGVGTLRQAFLDANAHSGADTIEFDIAPASCFDGICTIYPLSALPTLTDDETTLDGYTQPGASAATASAPADIRVQIDGRNTTNCNGLGITSADNLIQGLAIFYFDLNGIAIAGSAATGNVIAGNYIGVVATGVVTLGNGLDGVYIGEYLDAGAANNTVGGDAPAERNVISGNGWAGVGIWGADTTGNVVSGNYIGVD